VPVRMKWIENAEKQSSQKTEAGKLPQKKESGASLYHLRPIPCCILAGDTDGGGLDMLTPVWGFTIGIALRIRVADG
jgi:hypothetical protein